MPEVPKPSQVVKSKPSTHTAKSGKGTTVKEHKPRGAHIPPTKGKSGKWLAEIKEQGGITRESLIAGCSTHGLGPTMYLAMAGYCRQLGLLKG